MPANASSYSHHQDTKVDAWLYLDELTHRTLNDYSIMLSLIRRASSGVSSGEGMAAVARIARQLEAGAAVFGALRPTLESRTRNLDEDLEQLCASLSASRLADRGICLTLFAEPIVMSSLRSWKVCLIVSELITNAAKHAFGRGGGGTIVVNVRADHDAVICIVRDNGNANPNPMAGGGSRIVDGVAADLGGMVVRDYSESGATVCLRVPLA